MDSSNNNSFGGVGVPVISSGPADGPVFYSNDSRNRGGLKKKLIILGIVVAMVLVAVGVGVALIFSSRGSRDVISEEFNIFANYVLYGKEENSNINLNNVNLEEEDYVVTGNLDFQDDAERGESVEYYSKLYDLKNVFVQTYGEEKNSTITKIDQIVTFLRDYIEKSDPTVANLASLYGKDESYIENYVNNYYKVFNDSDNEYANRYGAIKTEILRSEAEISAKYNLFGVCLSKEVNTQDCVAVLGSISEEDKAKIAQGDTYVEDASYMVERDSRELVYYVIEMAKTLEGKK